MNEFNEFNGPFFTPDLIGPSGKLSRLHKGGGDPPKPVPAPPPVRESNTQTAAAGEAERKRAANRTGYASTLNPKAPQSLLGSFDVPGSRGLL